MRCPGTQAPKLGIRERQERGYSLTEVAVAMGVLGIIGVMVGAVVVATLTYTQRGAAEGEAQQVTRLALTHLVQELREASGGPEAITIWPAARDEPFEAIGFVSARQEISGRPFGADQDGQPMWRTAVYYVFDRERGELRRMARSWIGQLSPPSSDEVREGRVVARGVKHISVTREQDLVRIAMDVTVGRRTIRLDTSVVARN
ncbi:MAG: prepilin-type N-terminal cleavage/methylation domain-containing protein [bacterium]